MSDNARLSVLFVGEEPLMVGLPVEPVAKTGESWNTRFASNAAEALQLLASDRFDVVVSDLHLPGSSGIEFLKTVRQQHPLAGRIIYSSDAEQSSLPSAVDCTDRCLLYPCSIETLVDTIEGAAAHRARLSDADLREKISKMERIPSLPKLYQRLVAQLESLDADLEDISRTVSEDIGMTAQILKLVSSAYFGVPQTTSNVREVISFLGTETIKYLVLAIGVFRQFDPGKMCGFPLEALWNHSARTATAAKLIAKSERAGRAVIEHAATAGLLHDVGQIVLAVNYPEPYREIRRKARAKHVEWIIEEREVFGFDHAQVGGCILGLWGLPAPLVEAVTFHHAPLQSAGKCFNALTAVHVANVQAHTQVSSYTETALPQVDQAYLERIGRADALDRWREELDETIPA